MSRAYKKRTISTGRKTYADYLAMRAEQSSKGYELQDVMSEASFNSYYDRLIEAKKAGEIKSTAWQYLKSKERWITNAQSNPLAKAATDMLKELAEAEGKTEKEIAKIKVTTRDIKQSNRAFIETVGAYLNIHKESGLYGGKYE